MAYAKPVTFSLIVVAAVLGAFIVGKDRNQQDHNKLQVVASFYPLAYFAQEIGGDKVEVTNITPAGAEPHEYEPTAQDIARIEDSGVLILNGSGLEPWGDNVKANRIVIAGEDFVGTDPHVWLAPLLAQQMVDKIAEAVPGNPEPLKEKLAALDAEFHQGLSRCATRDIVTSHAAFGYLTAAYDLRQVPITGISPEDEPSAQELAQIADFAKKNNIKYIFFESLVSPKLAQTIAREVGAQTLVLNPIEGLSDSELAQGKNYFTEMRANLSNLKLALQCTN